MRYRKGDTTSLTMNASVPGFPACVVVIWEPRTTWRKVLRAVKRIAGELHGATVRWRDVHVFESPWSDAQEQADGVPKMLANARLPMFSIDADGRHERLQLGALGAPARHAVGRVAPERADVVGKTHRGPSPRRSSARGPRLSATDAGVLGCMLERDGTWSPARSPWAWRGQGNTRMACERLVARGLVERRGQGDDLVYVVADEAAARSLLAARQDGSEPRP